MKAMAPTRGGSKQFSKQFSRHGLQPWQQHHLGNCFRPRSRHSEADTLEGEPRNLCLMNSPGDSNAHWSLGTTRFSSLKRKSRVKQSGLVVCCGGAVEDSFSPRL